MASFQLRPCQLCWQGGSPCVARTASSVRGAGCVLKLVDDELQHILGCRPREGRGLHPRQSKPALSREKAVAVPVRGAGCAIMAMDQAVDANVLPSP